MEPCGCQVQALPDTSPTILFCHRHQAVDRLITALEQTYQDHFAELTTTRCALCSKRLSQLLQSLL